MAMPDGFSLRLGNLAGEFAKTLYDAFLAKLFELDGV
jgi:hypothetical protein